MTRNPEIYGKLNDLLPNQNNTEAQKHFKGISARWLTIKFNLLNPHQILSVKQTQGHLCAMLDKGHARQHRRTTAASLIGLSKKQKVYNKLPSSNSTFASGGFLS